MSREILFEDKSKKTTDLIITDAVLDKMETEAAKLNLHVDKDTSYTRRQQLLTIMSMINVLEENYNVILPIEISKDLINV